MVPKLASSSNISLISFGEVLSASIRTASRVLSSLIRGQAPPSVDRQSPSPCPPRAPRTASQVAVQATCLVDMRLVALVGGFGGGQLQQHHGPPPGARVVDASEERG